MPSKFKIVQLIWVTFICALNAFAQNIQYGVLSYSGSGCPSNTVRFVHTEDGREISLLFDQFLVEASGNRPSEWSDMKNCSVSIPILVPQGYQATIFKIDYRGYVLTPVGGHAKLQISYQYSRRRGLVYTQVFPGGKDENYLITNDLEARNIFWSQCAEKTVLKIDANLFGRGSHQGDLTYLSIDSSDLSLGIRYFLQLRPCH